MEFRGGRGAQNAGNHERLGVDSLRDSLIQYGRQCWMGQPIPEEPPPLGSFAGLLGPRDGVFGQAGLQAVKAGTGTMCNLPMCSDDARRVYRGKTKSFVYCQAALNLCGDAVCLRLWVRESRGRNSPRSYSCLPVFGCGNPRNWSGVAYCSPPMRWLWSCERGARGPEGFIVRRVFS